MPAITATPAFFAAWAIDWANGPSTGSAAGRTSPVGSGSEYMAFSGSTTREVPRSAASAIKRVAVARFCALSFVAANWATVTYVGIGSIRILGGSGFRADGRALGHRPGFCQCGAEARHQRGVVGDQHHWVRTVDECEFLLGLRPGRQHPRLSCAARGVGHGPQVGEVGVGPGIGATCPAQRQIAWADEHAVDRVQGQDCVDLIQGASVLDHRVDLGLGVLCGHPDVVETAVARGPPTSKAAIAAGRELAVCANGDGVSEVLHVRDDHHVGAEVERLLDRAALGCKDFREHPQTDGPQERYEPLEVGEIERSVFDVEYDCSVSEIADDLCGRGVRSGQPRCPAAGRVVLFHGHLVVYFVYSNTGRPG